MDKTQTNKNTVILTSHCIPSPKATGMDKTQTNKNTVIPANLHNLILPDSVTESTGLLN